MNWFSSRKSIHWGILLGVLVVVSGFYFSGLFPQWSLKYPSGWRVPLRFWISDLMRWLVSDVPSAINFTGITFKEVTRFFAAVLTYPLEFAIDFLSTGFRFDPGDGPADIPRLPWLTVAGCGIWFAHRLGGLRLALIVGACLSYLVIFGQWDSAMMTFSSILIAVPIGVVGGISLGILAFRFPRLEKPTSTLLDMMQTVPVFAYLVPVLFLFGFGPVAAMIATIIYAMPPMVRTTMLGLQRVSEEVVEFGQMAGCSSRQLLWKVMMPSARQTVMVGVNQVIMLSLNMVIIASMIGAGGLGYDVLFALRRLDIGVGLEAGVAIVVLAIALDRLSQEYSKLQARREHLVQHQLFFQKYSSLLLLAGGSLLLGVLWSPFHTFPESWQFTTAPFWDALVKWINLNLFDYLDGFKNFILLNLLIPFKRFLLATPWPVTVALVTYLGYRLGGWKLSLSILILALFLAVNGLWPKAMVTVYLCGMSVLFAALLGVPLGIWAAENERAHRVLMVLVDTLQTLPSFVYLMPVVMLFRVGDFSAMIAVVAYAIAPAIRYTDLGIRKIPQTLIEAATTSGCTPSQMRWKVKLPLAFPEIMLGINQTVVMALSMLVITALVGTRELGQETYIALTKADTGRGLVAGVAIACIAMIVDRLISAWSSQRKQQLGLS